VCGVKKRDAGKVLLANQKEGKDQQWLLLLLLANATLLLSRCQSITRKEGRTRCVCGSWAYNNKALGNPRLAAPFNTSQTHLFPLEESTAVLSHRGSEAATGGDG